METDKLEKSIQEIFDGQFKFIVPLYQRNFAWRRDEIEQLLQDIYEAYKTDRNSYYYIGSLIVLKRANGDFEVIDGQQRLTALSLITKILRINDKPRLFYDSRPEVEEFFREFYDSEKCTIDYPQVFHLKNAIDYIKRTSLDASGKDNIKITDISDTSGDDKFVNYFANNVFLVMVEIPQDTDVASYFEIMNNRGEQLQKHEILKSFMLSKLCKTDKDKTKEFARIWDACSQMDIPIHKLFDVKTRKRYFNKDSNIDYDDFCFEGLSNETCTMQESKTISQILLDTQDSTQTASNDTEDEQDADESIYKSIIDFPNFLMHVFKVMFPDPNENKEIPLNEKFLLSTYKKLEDKIRPEDFIQTLFFCRTVFDRYIVKTISDKTDNEDGEKWTLRRPKFYQTSKNWKYVDTFGKGDDSNSNEQSRIIKALSMLQVTFRTRIYKNWLYEILAWFVHEKGRTFHVQYNEYINKLDDIILRNYKPIGDFQEIKGEGLLTKDNSYSLGTKTPHFIFNFIDYLYWVDAKKGKDNRIADFDFKYWNSVEHHMAREWAERNAIKDRENYIDNLGNLCLISKSSNSRLSDRDVKEKVDTFGKGNLGAKRQIMYKMTKESGYSWDKEQIQKHYNELIQLLNNRETILKNNLEAINCSSSNLDSGAINEVNQNRCHAISNTISTEMYPKDKCEESICPHGQIKRLMQNIDASGFHQWIYNNHTLVHELYLNYDGITFKEQPRENSLCCDSVFDEDGTISVLLFLRKNTKEATSTMLQDTIWDDYQHLEITDNGRCEIKTFNKNDTDETITNYFTRTLLPKMKQWREVHKEENRIDKNS